MDAWDGALEDDAAPLPEDHSLEGLHVLAIDDDEAVLLGMQSLLQSWGCLCTVASSGTNALERLGDDTPDLIITDFRLRHEETGKQVLQALRTHLGTAVPAIIMTGDTSPQRLRDAQSTSALLLHKPVSTSQLREAMVQLITQPQPGSAAGSAPDQADEAAATASDAAGP